MNLVQGRIAEDSKMVWYELLNKTISEVKFKENEVEIDREYETKILGVIIDHKLVEASYRI